jgi:membrane protein DedA with SNARE-associated domain
MLTLMLATQHWLSKLGNSLSTLITGFGGLGVMCVAVCDSSFLSLPEGNDVLIVVLSTGSSWSKMAYYVVMTVIGSVVGCSLLYFAGRKGGNALLRRRFSQQSIDRAERLFGRFGILTVLIPSILPPPMPFKIFVLSAGVFRLKPPAFLTAVIVGRTVRYSMWGILAVLYGNSVKLYMQQNLSLLGTLLFGGFALAVAFTFFYYRRSIKLSRKENI